MGVLTFSGALQGQHLPRRDPRLFVRRANLFDTLTVAGSVARSPADSLGNVQHLPKQGFSATSAAAPITARRPYHPDGGLRRIGRRT